MGKISSVLLVVVGTIASFVATNPIPNKQPHGPYYPSSDDKAKYLYLSTNVIPNAIRAIPVNDDGSLSEQGTTTLTGGNGGNELDPDGKPHTPDALGSQGSVQVADNLVFVVNAGSSTLSVLSISPADPSQLTLLGTPASTNGDFPVSVAVSSHLRLACVANGGARAGVSCANYSPTRGLGAFDALRPFNIDQKTPPIGPTNGPSDILFSEDESSLIVMVKGNVSTTLPGFVATYAVDRWTATVALTGTEITPPDSVVLFGTALIPGTDNVLASDAGFGGLILDLANLAAPPITVVNITGQKASCWAVVSPFTGTGFIDDVAVSRLVEVDLQSGAIVSEAPNMNNGQGMVDMRAVGDRIYALSPGNGTAYPAAVTVFDVSGGRGSVKSIQNFLIDGADANCDGLAVLTSGMMAGWGW